MTTRDPDPEPDDDEALHWAGDEARGRISGSLPVDPEADDADIAEAAPASRAAAASDAAPSAPRRSPAELAQLVVTGVFALAYVALVVGWIYSVQLLSYPGVDLLGEIMWQFGEFLALVSPVLWFAAVLALTPEGTRRGGLIRIASLLLGLGVLMPWTVVVVLAGGAS